MSDCDCEKFQCCKICAEIEPKETSIENQVLEYLNSLPHCIAEKVSTKGRKLGNKRIKPGKYETIGRADIFSCLEGYYIEIEIKKPGYKQSEAQKRRQEVVRQAKGEYWVVESLEYTKTSVKLFIHRIKNEN